MSEHKQPEYEKEETMKKNQIRKSVAALAMAAVVGVSLLGPHVGFAVANAKLWAMGVKLFSQVIVILSNYIFSKVLIFKKK